MATVTKGHSFTTSIDSAANLHSMVDSATVTDISNADISSSAAIAASKLNLATINEDVNFSSGDLYVDHSNGRVGMGTTSPSYDVHLVDKDIVFEDTDDGATGVVTQWHHNSASPAVSDAMVDLEFYGDNDGGSRVEYASIRIDNRSPTAGSHGADMVFSVYAAGSVGNYLELSSDIVFINRDADGIDFEVRDDAGNEMFHCDVSNGNVGIGGRATATSPLNITGLASSSAGLASGDVWSNANSLDIV